jgi:transcriptional regulator with XRE-family HTH domain
VSLKQAFGRHLRYLRKRKRISQDRLAELVDVSEGRVVRAWERGDDFPNSDNLQRLCKELNVTIRELFDFDFP